MEHHESFDTDGHSLFNEIFRTLTVLTVLRVIGIVLLLANLKSFPLIYHLRILNGVRFVLKSQRSSVELMPDRLSKPLITSSRAPLMEIDVFGHKRNSTYFAEVDIARAHFVSTIFSESIDCLREIASADDLSAKPQSTFTMSLGAVSCSFRKEISPYEAYDIWTRILNWDEKWLI